MTQFAQVALINTALDLLGREQVPDLTDASLEGSVAAVKLLRECDTARDIVLSRHGWTCALEYVLLQPAQIPNYSNWLYPIVYLVPGDGLIVWIVAGIVAEGPAWRGWEPRWQVGTTEAAGSPQKIIRARVGSDPCWFEGWGDGCSPCGPPTGCGPVCCDGPLPIAYVRRADYGALDAHLREAVALELAARGAYSVTGDQALAQKLTAQAEKQIAIAAASEGGQEGGQPPAAPSIPAMIRRFSR